MGLVGIPVFSFFPASAARAPLYPAFAVPSRPHPGRRTGSFLQHLPYLSVFAWVSGSQSSSFPAPLR